MIVAKVIPEFPRSAVFALLIFGLTSGCSILRSDPFDQNFGKSYRHTVREMVVHPEPPAERPAALEGLDSLSAEIVLKNYKKGIESKSGSGRPTFMLTPPSQ